MFRFLAIALMLLNAGSVTAQAQWSVANMHWKVSCDVARGSYEKDGAVQIFRTSPNKCSGGIFNQRSEIAGRPFKVTETATYLFESHVSMTTQSSDPFILFQIHDGRHGCSPPMSIRWQSNNTLSFDSDYTRDQGMAGCVENRALRDARYRGPALRRNGTVYKFQVLVDFDGDGGFDVSVVIDGKRALSGTYRPSTAQGFVDSTQFYFKHGVYSKEQWTYEFRSEGMRTLKKKT